MKLISCNIFLMKSNSKKISVIPGDGVGPEITHATLALMKAAGSQVKAEYVEAGASVFQKGIENGVPNETIDSISKNKIVLKGPLATPIGFGNKSANVTLRKFFETFANIRPAKELPGVNTPYSGRGIDLVIIRENIEDLYAGIEHMQTPNVAQCLKIISRLGCQKISRAAFDFAVSENRNSIVVATKANIMKLTEGMLKEEFENVSKNFPEIKTNHMLVDNCAHQLVINPEQFDVIVTSNMNGDILSDLASGLVGGLGFAPSANIGYDIAIFEPVHGTAPDIAGKNVVNPTSMILSAIMLLNHIDEKEPAQRLEQALYKTLEDGVHTKDLKGNKAVGTLEFCENIIQRMGQNSSIITRDRKSTEFQRIALEDINKEPGSRKKIGVDIFIETLDSAEVIQEKMTRVVNGTVYELKMISNRGTQVWPKTGANPILVDHFRCRFMIKDFSSWHSDSILDLLSRIGKVYRWMHVEKLEIIDGKESFSKAQGES